MKLLAALAGLAGPTPDGAAPAFFIRDLDPRALVVVWGTFVVAMLSVPKYDVPGVLAFAAFPVFVILAHRLPGRAMARRLLLLSPFVLVMAAANPFFDRTPFLTVGGLAISGGMVSAFVIVAKSIVSLLAVMTLVSCLPFPRLCAALRGLGAPEVFVTQLILLQRYLGVLTQEALALQQARDLRSFSGRGQGVGTTAKLLGSLLLRTSARAERIYRAMVARGFAGSLPQDRSGRWGWRELAFLVPALLLFLVTRVVF